MITNIFRAAVPVFLSFFLSASALAQFVSFERTKVADMTSAEWVTQVAVSPSGKEIVSAGVDGRVVIWDAASGKVLREVTLPTIVLTIAVSSDGVTAAAGDASGKVSLIDLATARITGTFTADKKLVNTAAWTPDGKFLAAGGTDGVARIWSVSANKITSEIAPGHGDITALLFSKEQLIIGLRDGKERKRSAEVWDWQKRSLLRSFDEGPAAIRGISVSPDGKLLAIADYQEPTLLTMIPTGGGGAEVSLRVLPESDDPVTVAIWDLTSGKRVNLINGETGARSVAFSPDGQMLATAGPNGVVVHDIGSGTFAEIGRIDLNRSVDSIAFTPDSKHLVIAREREPLVGPGGLEKLVDPFFTSVVMQVRQGLNSGVLVDLGAKVTSSGVKTPDSSTGGSTVELWQAARKTADPDVRSWEAVRAYFNDKPEDAKTILQQTIKNFPAYGEAQRLYALLVENKDASKMLDLLSTSVKSDPGCLSCWRSLGDLQMKMERPADAVQSYDGALRLKPEYGLVAAHQAYAYGAVGLSFLSSGNTARAMDAAKDALARAIALRPGEEVFYTNLGAAYYFRSEFDKDIEVLQIARRLRPDHSRIYYNLGHAYRYKGDKQKAIEAYTRYVQLGEEGEEDRVEKAKQFIKDLSK